jgi:hypothetical protein
VDASSSPGDRPSANSNQLATTHARAARLPAPSGRGRHVLRDAARRSGDDRARARQHETERHRERRDPVRSVTTRPQRPLPHASIAATTPFLRVGVFGWK